MVLLIMGLSCSLEDTQVLGQWQVTGKRAEGRGKGPWGARGRTPTPQVSGTWSRWRALGPVKPGALTCRLLREGRGTVPPGGQLRDAVARANNAFAILWSRLSVSPWSCSLDPPHLFPDSSKIHQPFSPSNKPRFLNVEISGSIQRLCQDAENRFLAPSLGMSCSATFLPLRAVAVLGSAHPSWPAWQVGAGASSGLLRGPS